MFGYVLAAIIITAIICALDTSQFFKNDSAISILYYDESELIGSQSVQSEDEPVQEEGDKPPVEESMEQSDPSDIESMADQLINEVQAAANDSQEEYNANDLDFSKLE